MDVSRARAIIQSPGSIEVLYQGSPVWLERVLDNNTAEITNFNDNRKDTVPVYLLVEK